MENLVGKYLNYIENELNYSNHTVKNYQTDLSNFENYLKKENLTYQTVDYNNMRDFLNYLHHREYENKTINRHLSAIRSFFKYLQSQNIIRNNPLELITNNKEIMKIPNYLHYYEIEKLFAAVTNDNLGIRDRLILELLYSTGIRVSELVAIKLSDIDWYNNTIRIKGKGRRERIAIFGEKLKEALEQYLKVREKLVNKEIDSLLLNKNNRPLTDRGVRLIITKLTRKTDIQKIVSPHVIRHTYATHLLDAGADLKVVQELLGHKSIGSTGIYTHVSNEKLREVYRDKHPRAKK